MKYRQYFGLTWQEYLRTPPEVVMTDLEMMGIEAEQEEIARKKQKGQTS